MQEMSQYGVLVQVPWACTLHYNGPQNTQKQTKMELGSHERPTHDGKTH